MTPRVKSTLVAEEMAHSCNESANKRIERRERGGGGEEKLGENGGSRQRVHLISG